MMLDEEGRVVATPGLVLPEPWEIRQSRTFEGQFYFYNKKTKKSEWGLLPSVVKCEPVETSKAETATLPRLHATTAEPSSSRTKYPRTSSSRSADGIAKNSSRESNVKKSISMGALSTEKPLPSLLAAVRSPLQSVDNRDKHTNLSDGVSLGTISSQLRDFGMRNNLVSLNGGKSDGAVAAAAAVSPPMVKASPKGPFLPHVGNFAASSRTAVDASAASCETSAASTEASAASAAYRVVGGLGQGGFAVVVAAEFTGRSSPPDWPTKENRRGGGDERQEEGSLQLPALPTPPRRVALKVVSKDRVATKQDRDGLRVELKIMREAAPKSPWLMGCYAAFETKREVFFVLDLVGGGDLFYHLAQRTKRTGGLGFDEPTARVLLAEVVLGVTHLHDLGFVHRDLKIENVMLDQAGHVKLVDFGLSCAFVPLSSFSSESSLSSSSSSSSSGGGSRNSGKVEKSSSKSGGLSTGLVETFPMTPTGSLVYMAPEGLGEPHVGGRFTDWWAVGVLAHELLVGRTPWSSMKDKEVIQDEILASRVAPPKGLSPRAGKLVCSLLCHDHTARLGSSSDREIQSAAFFRPVDWALTARQQAPPAFRLPCGGGGGETFSEWLVSESSKETVLNVLVSAKDRNGALEEYQKRCRRSEEESRKEGNPAKNKKKSLAAAMVAAVTRRGGGGGGSAAGRSNSKAAASSKTGGDDTQDKVWYFGLDVVASPPEYVPGASWFSTGAPAGK